MSYDKIIIGAGLYGLYAAEFCAKQGEKVLVLECDAAPFKRATFVNQARVHKGYHYPRSYSTAIRSAHYFQRFNEEYGFCVHSKFSKIYATSANFSWTNAIQFQKFCHAANIRCDSINPSIYFNDGMCDGAFLTEEYTYDAAILVKYFLEQLAKYSNVELLYNTKIEAIKQNLNHFTIGLSDGSEYSTEFLLNATYASSNQIIQMVNAGLPNKSMAFQPFKIKYELCEIILCDVNTSLQDVGITVMDGPFFSIMPFGKSGLHSLTSVTFTPHVTSFDTLPQFDCQKKSNRYCSPERLGNCNDCQARPESAWIYMSSMARKYLLEKYHFEYVKSLFSMKPILQASEIDDSRPTVIKQFCEFPVFISVFSGKINTVYDLDEVLTK